MTNRALEAMLEAKASRPKYVDHDTGEILGNRPLDNVGISEREWYATVKYYDNRCAYCGGSWTDMEHVIPQSKGGNLVFGNIVPSCKHCNSKKGARTPEQAGMQLRDGMYFNVLRCYVTAVLE